MRRYLVAVLLIVAPSLAQADKVLSDQKVKSLPVAKNAVVLLKLPFAAFEAKEKYSRWTGADRELVAVADGSTVNGRTDWISAGFPPFAEYKVSKTKQEKGSDALTVEMKPVAWAQFPSLKVDLRGDPAASFATIFTGADGKERYRAEAHEAMAARFFTGPLAQIPKEAQLTLVAYADMTARGTTIQSATYKENLYLVVDLGSDPSAYNDLKMNQTQRVAHVMNESLLATMKAFAKPVRDAKEIYGLKLEFEIPHRNFLEAYAMSVRDKLEVYAPSDLIRKFADADITSQQLIDGSVVIVNSNRVQIPLSE